MIPLKNAIVTSCSLVAVSLLLVAGGCASRKQLSSGSSDPAVNPDNPGKTSEDASKLSDLDLIEVPPNYVSMTAEEKQDFIWKRTVETKFQTLPEHEALKPLNTIGSEPTVTMNRTYDTMPREVINKFKVRDRVIHTQGAMVKVKFVPSPGQLGGYTGTLAQGSKHGLLRLSTVAKVGGGVQGVTPGFGLKFFVDGKVSPSLVAMFTLEGQGPDYNFFTNDFYTVVPVPKNEGLKLIDARFKTADDKRTGKNIKIARIISAEPFTEVTESGQLVPKRKTPHFLKFEPSALLKSGWGPSTEQDVRVKLTESGYISAGTLLYKVFACETLVEPRESCTFTPLGELVADSEVVASRFGDKAVFFNHRAYDADDFDKYPAPDGSSAKK